MKDMLCKWAMVSSRLRGREAMIFDFCFEVVDRTVPDSFWNPGRSAPSKHALWRLGLNASFARN